MKIKNILLAILIFFPLLLLLLSCQKDPPVTPTADPVVEPPKYEQSIFLSVIDSGLTEVYLKLTITDTLMPRGFEIQRNNLPLITGSLCSKETTIVDQTAEMHSTYSYRAFRTNGSIHKDSTSVVSTQTLDTTSHEFIWTIESFGGGIDPSYFTDVTVLANGNIWCVGVGSILDSATRQSVPFNAVYWNGVHWTILQVPVRDWGTLVGVFPIQSVYGFSDSDVWMASYADVIQWDGSKCSSKAILATELPFLGQVSKIWGVNNDNQYLVGRNGAIYHFTNLSWQKLPSGTTVDLTDVFGTPDGETIWACGYKYDFTTSVLLQYSKQSNTWKTLWTIGAPSPYPFDIVGSIWGNRKLYVASGAEVYEVSGNKIKIHSPWFQNFIYRIRGNGENDIVAVTSGGGIWHYNGSNWKKIYANTHCSFYSIAIKGNTIVAVGVDASTFPTKALALVGHK